MVEVAIVMVIIGLLIGGVLKGQSMLQNAKVMRVVKQTDEMRAAVMGFYDKYGAYPGDEAIDAIPPGTDSEGNGNGQISGNEHYELWRDLQLAGLISGSYNGTSDLPKHPFGDDMLLYWTDPGPGQSKHYFRFDNLPSEVCLEIDSKLDDGVYDTGSICANAAYTDGGLISYFYVRF